MPFATPFFMGVRRYQDLDAWRLANELKREVYALIENSPARTRLMRYLMSTKAPGT